MILLNFIVDDQVKSFHFLGKKNNFILILNQFAIKVTSLLQSSFKLISLFG